MHCWPSSLSALRKDPRITATCVRSTGIRSLRMNIKLRRRSAGIRSWRSVAMLRPCHAQRVRRRRRGVILPFYLQARRATPGGWLSQTIELLEMGAVKSSWDYTGGISCTGCISISECSSFYTKPGDLLPGPSITRASSRRIGARPPATLERSAEGGRPPSTLHFLLQHSFSTASPFTLV
jgi:hypothetical protein